jgi:hypothetical protein
MNSEVDSIRDEYVSKLFTFGCIDLKCLKQEYLILSSKRTINEEFKSIEEFKFVDDLLENSGGLVECNVNLQATFKKHLILQKNTLQLVIDSCDSNHLKNELLVLFQNVEKQLQSNRV